MGKYLKYAFGEILLVVIGILIALWINNWNQNRNIKKTEQVLLKKLKEENKFNLSSLTDDIEYREELPEALDDLHYFLDTQDIEEQQDSLKYLLEKVLRVTSYTFSETNLANYSNNYSDEASELSRELSVLQNLQEDLELLSIKGMDFRFQYLFDVIKNEVDFSNLDILSLETIKSIGFRNNIILISGMEEEVTIKFKDAINQMQKVDKLITNRLEK